MIQLVVLSLARWLVRREWVALEAALRCEVARASLDSNGWPPTHLWELLISGEDHRFFEHPGYDAHAIARSAWRRVATGRIEGASTIAQQLVRVTTGRYERTLMRKLREILLAVLVTNSFPRAILPGLYLRVGYYGWRMNGFTAALERLGLSARTLTLQDAARIVACLKYPQPQAASATRLRLIERRAGHLMRLREKHARRAVYSGLRQEVIVAAIQSA